MLGKKGAGGARCLGCGQNEVLEGKGGRVWLFERTQGGKGYGGDETKLNTNELLVVLLFSIVESCSSSYLVVI